MAIRINADGSMTVGILEEEPKDEKPEPTEEKPQKKSTRTKK